MFMGAEKYADFYPPLRAARWMLEFLAPVATRLFRRVAVMSSRALVWLSLHPFQDPFGEAREVAVPLAPVNGVVVLVPLP